MEPGGRLVVAFNSPYGAVVRGNVADYFESGATAPYQGFQPRPDSILPEGIRFPRFMLLAFTKP